MHKSIAEIKKEFEQAEESQVDILCCAYGEDSRTGVQNLIRKARKAQESLAQERERTKRLKEFEYKYEYLGYVCGIIQIQNLAVFRKNHSSCHHRPRKGTSANLIDSTDISQILVLIFKLFQPPKGTEDA